MKALDGVSIRRMSTASQVAEVMTDLILRGEVRAGEHLRENALVTSLGVSRNTVREALRLLEQGGLVRHEFNTGAVVIEPSLDDLTDLYRLRLHLESTAAALEATPEQVARVRAAYEALREEAQRGDPYEIVAKDLAFHQSIVALVGSRRLNAYFAQLMVELRFFLQVLSFEDREYDRPDALMAQHDLIMEMIDRGDPAGAAEAVSRHIRSSLDRLSAILAGRKAESEPH